MILKEYLTFGLKDTIKYSLKGSIRENRKGYMPTAKKLSILILLLSVASIRRNLLKTT